MLSESTGLALICLLSWGVGAFVAKLATNLIGSKSVFFDVLGYSVVLIIYCLVAYKSSNLLNLNKTGVVLAVAAGIIGSVASVAFYMLLTKKDASAAVPMTALYPVLTAILAFIFLKEELTLAKTVGIVLSGVALYLLSI